MPRLPSELGSRTVLRTGLLMVLMCLLIAEGAASEEAMTPVFKGLLEPCCSSPIGNQQEVPDAPTLRTLSPVTSAASERPQPNLELDFEYDGFEYDGSKYDRSGSLKMGLAPAPPIRARFNGLDQTQAAHQGQESFPPDTSIAAGETRVLQAANSALRLSNLNGSNPIVKSLNDFFSIPDGPMLFQPKVYYDRMEKRFHLAALSVDVNSRESTIHYAVSALFDNLDNLDLMQSPQGGGSWCTYRIAANFAVGEPAYSSTLSLGLNEQWIALGTDHLKFSDGGFRSSVLHAIDKLSLTNARANSCPTLSFARLNIGLDAGGRRAAALQPAQHYTNNPLPGRPLYLVSTQTLVNSSDIYTLWRLRGNDTDSLTLSRFRLRGNFTYSQPPTAPQRGGLDLETGDTRITQAAFRDGRLWAVHATGCNAGKGPEESCLRLLEITPDVNRGEITYQENLARANLFLWAPGLAVNFHGDVLVPFQRSKNGQHLGIGYVIRRAAKGSLDAMRNLSSGQCALAHLDEEGRNLTDFSAGAQTDPRDSFGFWVAGEYPGNIDDLGCNWRTRIGLARDREPVAPAPIVLARGEFVLPGSANVNDFHREIELNAAVPAGLDDTSGRFLVVALRDASRPDMACQGDHPSNGCVAVDYPMEAPDLGNSNWATLRIGNQRQTLYLTESQDLSLVPDPMKPN